MTATDLTGTFSIGNNLEGVRISDGASNNVIGGPTEASRNIISGNGRNGIFITQTETTGNLLLGNFIGTDVSGTIALGNFESGVYIKDAVSNTIGGAKSGMGNVISGNRDNGVTIVGFTSTGNIVQGNLIGIDITGSIDIGNKGHGVSIEMGSHLNIVGGSTSLERNVISGNDDVGILISDLGSDNNAVIGNFIGTDISGTLILGNLESGIAIEAGAKFNRIGGSAFGEKNIISGNYGNGVYIHGSDNNTVIGNYIGTDITGIHALGNRGWGIRILGNSRVNTIGTDGDGVDDAVEGNLVIGNSRGGIELMEEGAGNLVQGNIVENQAAGTTQLDSS